jgi:hypothetical protein
MRRERQGRGKWNVARVDAASIAGHRPAKISQQKRPINFAIQFHPSLLVMPALQQITRIEFFLLPAGLFLLVEAALVRAQSFENLAFPIGLMVFAERFLAQNFELTNVRLEFLAEALHVLPQNRSELKFGGCTSCGERGRGRVCGVGEEAVELCQFLLPTGNLEIGLL